MRFCGVMIFCFVDFLRVFFVCDRVVWSNCVSASRNSGILGRSRRFSRRVFVTGEWFFDGVTNVI